MSEFRGIVDFHVHITRNLDDCGRVLESARRCGVEVICASSLGDDGYLRNPTPEQFRSANDYVLEAMERFPGRIVGFCYLNPNYPEESLREMERCVARGMKGAKLWIACKASDPKVYRLVEKALKLNIPVLQHSFNKATGNLPQESGPEDVAELARRFPEAKIVMAHLFGNGRRGIAEVADLKNVYVDLCGSEPEAGLTEYAVEELGAGRLLFGSDAPGRDFSVQMGKVLGASIGEEEKERILFWNAAELLGLGPVDLKLPDLRLTDAVDVNAYVGEYPFRPLLYSRASELSELMKRYGISRAWVSSVEAMFREDPREANRRLVEEISGFPELEPVAVVNPAIANWKETFGEAVRMGVRAFKLHPNYHGYSLSAPRASEFLREAGRAGFPVIVQLRVQDVRTQNPLMVVEDFDVEEVLRAARELPGTRLMIGGVRWDELLRLASEVRDLPNLWVDISCLERMDGLREALDMVGAEKLLFGTHAPFFYMASAVLKVNMAGLEAHEVERILSGNARLINGGPT
ncbi:MAG: hypothetical protein DRP99_04590 [Candidatus Latescibacterota bacterium]|nr:MAG: hypothetical protein DRP99_04590 [Candidatus Latescibacterota bacterium]